MSRIVIAGTALTKKTVKATDLPADKDLRQSFFRHCIFTNINLSLFNLSDADFIDCAMTNVTLPTAASRKEWTVSYQTTWTGGNGSITLPPWTGLTDEGTVLTIDDELYGRLRTDGTIGKYVFRGQLLNRFDRYAAGQAIEAQAITLFGEPVWCHVHLIQPWPALMIVPKSVLSPEGNATRPPFGWWRGAWAPWL